MTLNSTFSSSYRKLIYGLPKAVLIFTELWKSGTNRAQWVWKVGKEKCAGELNINQMAKGVKNCMSD